MVCLLLGTHSCYKMCSSNRLSHTVSSLVVAYMVIMIVLTLCYRFELNIQPSHSMCEDLAFGRMSFKGFNPAIEVSMLLIQWTLGSNDVVLINNLSINEMVSIVYHQIWYLKSLLFVLCFMFTGIQVI